MLDSEAFHFKCVFKKDLLRVRYRIYKLSAELMEFYIARKPTYSSRSLNLELPRLGFLIKSGLFEQPLLASEGARGKRKWTSLKRRENGLNF
jgi:hypothetical protein